MLRLFGPNPFQVNLLRADAIMTNDRVFRTVGRSKRGEVGVKRGAPAKGRAGRECNSAQHGNTNQYSPGKRQHLVLLLPPLPQTSSGSWRVRGTRPRRRLSRKDRRIINSLSFQERP
jgi:hypothetical protein